MSISALLVLLASISFTGLVHGAPPQINVGVIHHAHPSDGIDPSIPQDLQASEAYASTFEKLVSSGAWTAASSLAPLKDVFSSSPRLSQESFTNAWRKWRFHHLLNQWVVDEDGRGLWKIQDRPPPGYHADPDNIGLTMGIRKQPDGGWWFILLRTNEKPGVDPWPCSPTCQVVISSGPRRHLLTARPPLGYDYRSSDVVGAPLPTALLVDDEDTTWQVQPPGEDQPKVEFDVSWLLSICSKKLDSCP